MNMLNRSTRLALAVGATLTSTGIASAASGTWNRTTDGVWTLASNWSSNAIADGADSTASFGTNVPNAATLSVTLNGSRTIGNINFSDSDTYQSVGNWLLTDAGNAAHVLTLAGAAPTISVSNMGTGIATINATIAGNNGLVKTGSNVLALTGTNTYTGGTTVRSGILRIGDGVIGNIAPQALRFIGASSINFMEAVDAAQQMDALTFAAGAGNVTSTYAGSGNSSLTFASVARTSGATGNFVVSDGANGTTNKIVLTGASEGFIDQGTFFNGNNYAIVNADKSVRGIDWDSSNSFAGGTTLVTTGLDFVQTTTSVTAQSSATLKGLSLVNTTGTARAFTLANGATLTTNGIIRSGAGTGAYTISGGTAVRADADTEMVIRTDLSTDAMTISTPIIANGDSSVTKSGAGSLTLNATNTYSGGTFISEGNLIANTNQSLGLGAVTVYSGGSLTVNNGNVANTINLRGGSITLGVAQLSGTINVLESSGFSGTMSGSLTSTMSGALVLSDGATFTLGETNGSCTLSAVVSGNGTLSSGVLGNLNLPNANPDFTGTLRLTRAVAVIGNDQSLGTADLVFASRSGAVGLRSSDATAHTLANDIVITTGPIFGTTSGVTGNLTLTGGISGTLSTTVYNTTVQLDGLLSGTNAISLNSGSSGTLILTNQNTNTGVTTVSGGTLSIASLGNAGAASNIGQATNAASNLVLGNGRLKYTGPTTSTNRLFSVSSNPTLDASGSGPITFSGTGQYATPGTASVRSLTLAGSNTGLNTLAGVVKDSGTGANITSLTKSETGTWVLTGANLYTGGTTVSGGKLLVNNATGSGTGTGAVNVNAGTLGGSGFITGNVNVNAGTISPGNSAGLLTVGALALGDSATTLIEIGGDVLGTAYDSIAVATPDSLTYGGSLSIVAINGFDLTQEGAFQLFTFTGSATGNFAGISVGTQALARSDDVWTGGTGGVSYTFTQSTGELVVAVPEPGTLAALAMAFGLGLGRRRRAWSQVTGRNRRLDTHGRS